MSRHGGIARGKENGRVGVEKDSREGAHAKREGGKQQRIRGRWMVLAG